MHGHASCMVGGPYDFSVSPSHWSVAQGTGTGGLEMDLGRDSLGAFYEHATCTLLSWLCLRAWHNSTPLLRHQLGNTSILFRTVSPAEHAILHAIITE